MPGLRQALSLNKHNTYHVCHNETHDVHRTFAFETWPIHDAHAYVSATEVPMLPAANSRVTEVDDTVDGDEDTLHSSSEQGHTSSSSSSALVEKKQSLVQVKISSFFCSVAWVLALFNRAASSTCTNTCTRAQSHEWRFPLQHAKLFPFFHSFQLVLFQWLVLSLYSDSVHNIYSCTVAHLLAYSCRWKLMEQMWMHKW